MRKLNNESFIQKANFTHNSKYGYDFVNYINGHTNVVITCKVHGNFSQLAYNHLNVRGCYQCSGKYPLNKETFIEKSQKIFNYLYDYSEVNYFNNETNVKIGCRDHGFFFQLPYNHLVGNGCPICAGNTTSNKLEFVEKADLIHHKIYNYDLVDYETAIKKVKIICKKHGSFDQTPNKHLGGSGCPMCSISKGEFKIKNILDRGNIEYKTQYTFKDLIFKKRLKFDFAIFNQSSLRCLIEFNGVQHYRYYERFHKNVNGFEMSQVRDNLKIEYCNNNNIDFHIIKYNDDIDILINKILKKYE